MTSPIADIRAACRGIDPDDDEIRWERVVTDAWTPDERAALRELIAAADAADCVLALRCAEFLDGCWWVWEGSRERDSVLTRLGAKFRAGPATPVKKRERAAPSSPPSAPRRRLAPPLADYPEVVGPGSARRRLVFGR
jgi:hypothetical protein